MVYLVEDYMFRSIMHINTPRIMSMFIVVSSHFCSSGHGRNHVASNHVNLICVRYFDSTYAVIPLVVSCERRLHDTSPLFGPIGRHWEVISRSWVARVTEA